MTSTFSEVGLGLFLPLYVLQMHADVDGENLPSCPVPTIVDSCAPRSLAITTQSGIIVGTTTGSFQNSIHAHQQIECCISDTMFILVPSARLGSA